MSVLTISQLEEKFKPVATDELVLYDSESKTTKKIMIASLPNLITMALGTPCKYCGSRGNFDSRGNCGSCGAPIQ